MTIAKVAQFDEVACLEVVASFALVHMIAVEEIDMMAEDAIASVVLVGEMARAEQLVDPVKPCRAEA